jgi:nicotinate-nucleotide adenylyltransferase
MKIGIFGGSFNPPTKGHTRLANYIAESGVVDRVYMMPCYKSLYNKELTSGSDRLKMIELASRHPHVMPLDWEIKNKIEGKGTYEIMKMLEREFAGDTLYFVIGLDNSQKVRTWRNGHLIIDELRFIVVPREGTVANDMWFTNYPHIYLKDYEPDDISSSKVKSLLKENGNFNQHLDFFVSQYIIQNQLYKE